jgi:predicted nucleic acid-binding protein
MVLVDTSIWVDHFQHKVSLLEDLLNAGEVVTHPFIIGELACSKMRNRAEILDLLAALPTVKVASHSEALHLVDIRSLHGKGIGWIDIHLLSSSLLNHTPLWTRDKKLHAAAKALGISEK